jgi:uncharacterized protein YxjI
MATRPPEADEMGLLGDRHHDGRRYQMREKLLSIGDDAWIEDDKGDKVFKVDGKALRVRDTFKLDDAHGNEVATIRERKLHVKDTVTVERDGHKLATIKKALVSPLRDRFEIELEGGGKWKAHGNVLDHEYKIEGDDGDVAHVSKKWLRVRDTYGIEISGDPNRDALVLAVTVAIDEMRRGK